MVENKPSSLASYWRKRKSSDPAFELAILQQQAQTFVGLLQQKSEVSWNAKGGEIQLDYRLVEKEHAPLEDITVDAVIAGAVHEAAHRLWTNKEKESRYWDRMLGRYSSHKPISSVAHILEDYYIEHTVGTKYPGIEVCINNARAVKYQTWRPDAVSELSLPNPSQDTLRYLWSGVVLGGMSAPPDISKEVSEVLDRLVKLTIKAAKAHKGEKRLKLSLEAYKLLETFPTARQKPPEPEPMPGGEQEGSEPQPDGQENASKEQQEESETENKPVEEGGGRDGEQEEQQEEESERSEASGGEQEEQDTEEKQEDKIDKQEAQRENEQEQEDWNTPLPDFSLGTPLPAPSGIAGQIEEILASAAEDLTAEVQSLLGGAAISKRVTMCLASLAPATPFLPGAQAVAPRIKQVFQWDKKLRTRFRRALESGKVDSRRLAKAGASDYRVFMDRDVLDAPSLGVVTLVDMSDSMGSHRTVSKGEKAFTALEIAYGLYLAFKQIRGVDLAVVSYSSPYGTDLYRIFDSRISTPRLGVKPEGGTPSGEAIAAILTRINELVRGKDKLIIHITDGAPDSHISVEKAVNVCRDRGVEVMTFIIDPLYWRYSRERLEKSYQGLISPVADISAVPEAIIELLKKRLRERITERR